LRRAPRFALRGIAAVLAWIHAATGWGRRYRHALDKASQGDELFYGSVAFAEGAAKEALFNGPTDASAYDSQNEVRDVLRPLRDAWPRHDIGAEVSYLDLKIRLAELLLMRIDKVTMSMGVEAREPFLDFHLVEYLMRLPLHLKVKRWSPKHLLKE